MARIGFNRYNDRMNIAVKPIKITQIPNLHKMFRRALYEDFAYFPGQYILQVSKANNYSSFLRAKFNPNRIMLGLFESNRMIGYAIADTSNLTDSDIFWFYITPENRHKGLGKLFFQELLRYISALGGKHVYLITHNQSEFYKHFDFCLINENNELFEDITMYEMAGDLY